MILNIPRKNVDVLISILYFDEHESIASISRLLNISKRAIKKTVDRCRPTERLLKAIFQS